MRLIVLVLALVLLSPAYGGQVNVYSARKEALIKPLLEQFSKRTGIEVRLLTGKADALLKRLEFEGKNSPADLLITTDAGRLHRARVMQLLQPVESVFLLENVPTNMRDRDGYWYGLSVRARPIMYARGRVKSQELSTYEALADPQWQGRVCVRSSDNIYNQSLVASMLEANGEHKTLSWAKGLVANLVRPPTGGDIDQIKLLASGVCDVTLVNTYYLGIMTKSRDKTLRKAAKRAGVFWPNQNDRGAHINVSGAGVTAHAKNRSEAISLLEFLLNEESQRWYARVNFEYPVRENIEVSKLLKQWGEFKPDGVNLTVLGEKNPQAVRIMDEAGWR